jgi:hypothetical protein
MAGNESDADCTFTQTRNDLAGTCGAAQGDAKITGKVNGKKVTWSFNVDYNGSQLTMKYDGVLDAGKITGTVNAEQFGVDGDFFATRLK